MQACRQPLGKNAGKNKKKRANKKRRAAAAVGKSSGAMTAQLGANRATVPQWFKISPDQVFNHAGGAVWKLTDAEHTMRYLIMGAKDNGNYYQTSEQVSSECSTSVLKMIRNPDPAEFQKLCEMLESISMQGRAARQEPTLLSLAAAIVFATTPAQKSMALGLVSKCVRIPTHLFMLSGYITDLSQCKPNGQKGKGWGAGVRRELAKYYVSRRGLELATAVTKYKNREGWCHRDLLRMLHINPAQLRDDGARLVFKYLFACDGGAEGKQFIRQLLSDILAAKTHDEAIQLLDKPISFGAKNPSSTTKAKPSSTTKAKPSSVTKALITGFKSAIQGIIGGQKPQHKTQINFNPVQDVAHVQIATSAFEWKRMFMNRTPTGFMISLELPVGTHDFKFIVGGVWQCDPCKPTRKTGEHENNFIVVSEERVEPEPAPVVPPPSAPVVPPPSELFNTAKYLQAVLEIESCTTSVADIYKALKLVRDHGLVREHIPTHLLNSSDLWKELLISKGANGKQEGMPIEALIRNLGKMSSLPNFMGADNTMTICMRLSGEEDIQRSRIHPFKVLVGSLTYGAGKALKGTLSWSVSSQVRDTLTYTFLKAFKNVSPTGKRYMVALDVSGSMDAACMGCPSITCRMASAALALMLYETEPKVYLRGFTAQSYGYGSTSSSSENSFRNFDPNVRRGMTLQQFISATNAPFGPTDCSLPMRRAIEDNLTDIEAFIVMTDSETYAGPIHPQVALENYRKFSKNPNVKLIVVGMTSNCLTIADPNDRNTLNLAGFDTAMPEIIAMFVRGEL
jgi:hypothetical protein